MREILFRGKREDNGEWVEGSLLFDPDLGSAQIIGFKYWTSETGIERGEFSEFVNRETVGQYTGATDKNGKKIFEDDIVIVRYEQSDGQEGCETKKVHYNSKECCWYPMRWDEHCEFCDNWTEITSIEVIGNIHDNPELMEGS